MKGRIVALDLWHGVQAAALVEDGRLQDFLVDPPKAAGPRPESIFRAIADRPAKGIGGSFVRLPSGATGFLRGKDRPAAGQVLLVQVTGFAEPGKAVPLNPALALKGRYAVATPGAPGFNVSRSIKDPVERNRLLYAVEQLAGTAGSTGLIVRSLAAGAAQTDVFEEADRLIAQAHALASDADPAPALLVEGPDAHALARRDWPDAEITDDRPGSFARHGIHEMIAATCAPQVTLPGGATAWIEPTRALVAVDVNTGGDTSPAAGLKANLALARDLPRLLRCRGLGGQITLDFAPMPKRDRRQVEQALAATFRADSIATTLAGWTPLGHFELQRRRSRYTLDGPPE